MLNPSVIIDATKLNNGLKIAQQFTRKTPADACNYAAKEVAYAAYQGTPVTGADRVSSDMGVVVDFVIGKKGQKTKRKKYSASKTVTVKTKNGDREVPLPVLIIQASSRAGSKYNELTGGRYQLKQSPFKGLSKAAGQAAMAAAVDYMTKARRKSANGFIRAGWLPAIKVLKALTSRMNYGQAKVPANMNEGLGTVYPAHYGAVVASCTIESDVGLEGKNGKSHNAALIKVGTPALQRAIDDVGNKQMQYVLNRLGIEDLEQPVNEAWK